MGSQDTRPAMVATVVEGLMQANADLIESMVATIVGSSDEAWLSDVATQTQMGGAALSALSYIAAYRVYAIFKRTDRVSDRVLRRAFRLFWHVPERYLPQGSTGLRARYNEAAHGWSSFDAWLLDWVSGVPVSRSSVWDKVHDIEGWLSKGSSWDTILRLLINCPMAGRDALQKPIRPEALPPGPQPEAQYLKELAELPPGQARRKVSEDAGEPQIYLLFQYPLSDRGHCNFPLPFTRKVRASLSVSSVGSWAL